MTITKNNLLKKLTDYMHHNISHESLVDWAENAMMEDNFDDKDYQVIRNTIARLGLADVKAFGLTWEDCEGIISNLGYKVKFEFEYA
jgi:hypothetical protein